MATIKSYTDIEQSKKLVEILPLESADMRYAPFGDTHPWVWNEEVKLLEKGSVPCWSLAALLTFLPKSAQLEKDNATELYRVTLPVELEASDWYIDPIDACYEMIIKLHELKML